MRKSGKQRFIERLNQQGRFEYIEGYVQFNKKVTLRHKACGKIVSMTACCALKENPYYDTCKACRGQHLLTVDSIMTKEQKYRNALIRYCKLETKCIFETMFAEGYVFDKELEEYVTYCIQDLKYISNGRLDFEDCLNLILENLYLLYKKYFIGKCRCCGSIYRGRQHWADIKMYRKRVCSSCSRKLGLTKPKIKYGKKTEEGKDE